LRDTINTINTVRAKVGVNPVVSVNYFNCTNWTYRLTKIAGNTLAGNFVSHDYSPYYIRAWGMGEDEGGRGKGEGGKGKYFFFKSPLPFTLFSFSNPQSLVFIP
jgi:hypothetical protein